MEVSSAPGIVMCSVGNVLPCPQITELQQRNEELEQELEKRKAREKVELVLSPIRQSVQVRADLLL